MKVLPIQKNLSCSYIYFKSTSNIQEPKNTPKVGPVYNISDVFSINSVSNNIKTHSISGICNNKDYNLNTDINTKTVTGNIGQEAVDITIGEPEPLKGFKSKNMITGQIGDKKINLVCTHGIWNEKLSGTIGSEKINVALRSGYGRSGDAGYADGKNIKLTISETAHITHTNYQAFGKSSMNKDFLPILSELMLAGPYTGLK